MREIEFLRENGPTARSVHHLNIAGTPVAVAANHPTLARKVERYFAPFLSEPAQNPMWIVGLHGINAVFDRARLFEMKRASGSSKEAFYDVDDTRVILKTRSGVVHYLSDKRFYAVGDLLKSPRQLLNLVSSAYAHGLKAQGYVAIHAAGISNNGLGIAFAANSGSGKSSVALRLVELGFDFVSNDRVYLKREGDVVLMAGVPKWPRVNPGTILSMESLNGLMGDSQRQKYAAMPKDELWYIEDKYDVRIDSIYGRSRVALRSRLDQLFVLTWSRRGNEMEIAEVRDDDLGDAIAPMIKTGLYDPPSVVQPALSEVGAVLKSVRTQAVGGGLNLEGLVNHVRAEAEARV